MKDFLEVLVDCVVTMGKDFFCYEYEEMEFGVCGMKPLEKGFYHVLMLLVVLFGWLGRIWPQVLLQ